jgi:hypothetical protein
VLPTIVWVSKDAFLSIGNVSPVLASDQLENWQNLHFHFTTTNGEFRVLFLTKPALPATLSDGESSIFWHTVMTSNCRKLVVASNSIGSGLCTAPVLTDFLGGSSLLRELVLMGFVFEKDHCHALATLERTDLDISFAACNFKTQDVNDLFIEWLRHSQVVTALTYCEMESCILSALRGNSSVKRLIYRTKCDEQGEDHLRSLAQALPGNQGLEVLDLSLVTQSPMSDETWNLLLRSLWTHPRIMSLILGHPGIVDDRAILSAESKAERRHEVVQMVRCNTVVQRICLPDELNDEEFYQNHILPRLEMNRSGFQEQRAALKRADPSIRGQLLGRALHVVRCNPDLLFWFISENVPAFVRTEEEERGRTG